MLQRRPATLTRTASGTVDHQHRLGVTQMLDHVGAQVIAHAVFVPHRPGQQVLHPIRGGIPGVLGERPAVLAWPIRKQPQHERPGPPAWLHPPKPARNPAQQRIQVRLQRAGPTLWPAATV
jgi:hypothetical protein